jgi:hypothetical protein
MRVAGARRLARAAGLALGLAAAVTAQARQDGIDGRTFADVRIGGAVQSGNIELRAARAHVWTESGATGGAVHRMVLSGDVEVTLGEYRFTAARAVVWLERLEEITQQADGAADAARKPAHQVAIYFDRVNDPTAEAGFSQFGDRLLVSALLEGEPAVWADVMRRERPGEGAADGAFLIEGEQRMGRFLRAAISGEFEEAPPEPAPSPPRDPDAPIEPGVSRPYEPGSRLDPGQVESAVLRRLPAERLPAIFSPEGLITLAPGDLTLVTGDDENALVATGGVVVTYADPGRSRSLQISAQRAVVFVSPGRLSEMARFSAKDVKGIYLEGDVVAVSTDGAGTNTLRGPRVFYDVQANKAVLVDAVFHTFDQKTRMPLYARARVMRQTATNQFAGAPMRLSNTSFFEPHLALGASEITVTRREGVAGEPQQTIVDADDLTLRMNNLPFFYWPNFKGDVENVPLRDVRVENSSGSGFAIKTGWDVFGVTGLEPKPGVDWQMLVDAYFERGPALGTSASWGDTRSDQSGSVFAYGIFNDTGTDQLTSGAEKKRDGETRGILLGEQRTDLDSNWSLFLEGAYLGDENFTDAFFEPLVETRREFTNAAYLRYLDDNTAFTLLGQANANNFVANEYLLQSRGYSVDRLPEAAYYRVADDLLAGIDPGALTWSQEYRLSNMALNFTDPTLDELGFDTPERAFSAFGISDPDATLAERERARGLGSNDVLRLDTRHEFTYVEMLGPVKMVPFAVGRFTGYDQTFEGYSPEADERYRLWGAAGLRMSTQITRIDDTVDSQWLDLYRMRHIIEPSATMWAGGANIDQQDLPVYDENVESVLSGSAMRVGVTNTWQTQRGGVGRWRSVDWIRWSNDLVFASDDAERESPVRRFFDFRPEYSQVGEFYTTDLAIQATDTLALTSTIIFDFETNQLARTAVGAVFDHSPEFSTGIEARSINVRNETLLDLYALYRLTRKYTVRGRITFDTDRDDVRSYDLELRRLFPSVTLGVTFSHDNVSDESSVGVILEPKGLETNQDRLRALQTQ